MAINKKLIHFKNKEKFEEELANNNILDSSIVFIQDSKEISTHGTVYKSVNWSVLEKPELYEWVDLGLPSGLKWASCNVGASKPEEFGLYFAWGETEGYEIGKSPSWDDYKFGTLDALTKYNEADGLTVLELEDDAAYQSDNTCRMPTKADVKELIANTTSTWEEFDGFGGRRFTSKTNSNSIFIPAKFKGGPVAWVGDFWTCSLKEGDTTNAVRLFFNHFYEPSLDNLGRNAYTNIRPIKKHN